MKHIVLFIGMSAFPESGRSGIMKTAEIKVRFRPKVRTFNVPIVFRHSGNVG